MIRIRNIRILLVSLILSLVLLSACSDNETSHKEDEQQSDINQAEVSSVDKRETNQKSELKVQILPSDLEDGTAETQIYEVLEILPEIEPNIGKSDAFSFEIVGLAFAQNDDIVFLIAGINRLPHAIKDFSLDFSLSSPEGEYIWKEKRISLNDTESNPIEENRIVPIVMELSEEEFNQIEEISFEYDYNELNLEVHDITYHKVK